MRPITAGDLMNPEILTVDIDMTVRELASFLVENEISGAPVRNREERIVGVVSLFDIAAVASDGEDGSEDPRKRQYDGNIRGLQVGWDGSSFVAAWSTVLFAPSGSNVGRPTNHLLLTRRIDPATGSFRSQAPQVVVQSPRALRNPYILSDGNGQLVLFYDTENEQGRKTGEHG